MKNSYHPVLLVILDGFGERQEKEGNAIRLANAPFLQHVLPAYPHALLDASGLSVGLPTGQMGNSEVGHLTIGAGRVIYQDLTRIDQSITDGSFFKQSLLLETFAQLKKSGKALHLLGLTSAGGIHSHVNHGLAITELAASSGLSQVFWHAFLDGRDEPPKSAIANLKQLNSELKRIGTGKLASLSGRFYAMDRDQRWDRVEAVYHLLTQGKGSFRCEYDQIEQFLTERYAVGQTDEFIEPTVLLQNGDPIASIEEGDVVIFFNFRSDRARELTQAFVQPDFSGFSRDNPLKLQSFIGMTQYDEKLNIPILFQPQSIKNHLGEYLSTLDIPQLRVAETEKYAHVTFFFNGGIEKPYPLEERILIPSRRDIKTYDLAPQMSAPAITTQVCEALQQEKYGLIVVNYANPDMVGHTGDLSATIKSIECIDNCLRQIVEKAQAYQTAVVITADHGNCEMMIDNKTHQPHTSHTVNLVPCYIIDRSVQKISEQGSLQDVAPTVLSLMKLPVPSEMEGKKLAT